MTPARIAVVLGFLFAPFAAEAQSFNCRYARSADEVAICNDDGLSALDERMARVFSRLRTSLDLDEREDLDGPQARWLRSRRECGSDEGCIEASYRRRIRQLQQY